LGRKGDEIRKVGTHAAAAIHVCRLRLRRSNFFFPDPDFYPSRIPYPTRAPKEEGENFFVLPFLVFTTTIIKLKIILFLIG
jgi:hypothetical protein